MIASINIKDTMFQMDDGCQGQCDMDTHADTCVEGGIFLACEFDGITCEVMPFTDEYELMKDVPIVTAATHGRIKKRLKQ
jgi:hypothetical protein